MPTGAWCIPPGFCAASTDAAGAGSVPPLLVVFPDGVRVVGSPQVMPTPLPAVAVMFANRLLG